MQILNLDRKLNSLTLFIYKKKKKRDFINPRDNPSTISRGNLSIQHFELKSREGLARK